MAATTITKKQQIEIQLAIVDRINSLSKLAKELDELGSVQDAEDLRHNVDDLNDAYRKSIQNDEWMVTK